MSEQKPSERKKDYNSIDYDDLSDSEAPSSVCRDQQIVYEEGESKSMDKLEEFVKFL